jgi:uncharacterized protein
VTRDRNGMESLTRAECLEFLAQADVGRVALNMGALPVILPVNYALFDEDILLRTVAGSKLEAATRNAVMAFEVDQVHPLSHTGWSVLVQGVASEITDPVELRRAKRVPLTSWLDGDSRYVRISSQLISGRRLSVLATGIRPIDPRNQAG